MLTFIGLGLHDHRDVSIRGLEAIQSADTVFFEGYTSRLGGTSLEEMEEYFERRITSLGRGDVEDNPEAILGPSESGDVVLLTGGDPMVSTTHADLRIRAHRRGVRTAIITVPRLRVLSAGSPASRTTASANHVRCRFPRRTGTP